MHTVSLYEYDRDNRRSIECWTSTNDRYPSHFHSSLEFMYITSGILLATINGRTYTVEAGDLLIVPRYSVHSYDTPRASVCYVLTIPPEQIPSYGFLCRDKMFASTLITHPEKEEELKSCLRAIRMYGGLERNAVNAGIVQGYAYVFLGLLIREAGLMDVPNPKAASLAQKILLYLQENFRSPLTLAGISAHFGYSKSRFSHVFNHSFGCTVTSYINNLRCQFALELMEGQNLTITEIALSSGFESTRTFYRAFKTCFGCSPKQYSAPGTASVPEKTDLASLYR